MLLTVIVRRHFRTSWDFIRRPRSVVHFLAGRLPGSALVHMRQLSLLGMISCLRNSILHHHAVNALNTKPSSNSWFHLVRNVCLQNQLPHPLSILSSPQNISEEACYKLLGDCTTTRSCSAQIVNIFQVPVYVPHKSPPNLYHCWFFSIRGCQGTGSSMSSGW